MASLKKRGKYYYLQYYTGPTQNREALGTTSYQVAKEKLRQYESKVAQGFDNPLPTKTPIPTVLQKYVDHIRAIKTPKSAQTDIYYLREAFGECCEGLKVTSRKLSSKTRKKKVKKGVDARLRAKVIEAGYFEQITTAHVSQFITRQVQTRGLAPKTANRYREIITRLFNWAMKTELVRMPGGRNPAAAVDRYKERAPVIRFLTLTQIEEQLHALRFNPKLQTMVAVLIYAGLRREELLWLTKKDVDLKRGMIRVQAKTIDDRFWEPKTKRNRVIPISNTLRTYLERYVIPKSEYKLFFPSPMGKLWDPDLFSKRALAKANKQIGLRWTCLDFRHTFGSQLAQKGVSLYKISALMGNSPEICRRHYAALVPEAMSDEVEFTSNDSLITLNKAYS